MRGSGGGFWLLAVSAAWLAGVTFVATLYASAATVPCHWGVLIDRLSGACAQVHWPFAAYPWLALGVLVALSLGGVVLTARTVAQQLLATRRLTRSLRRRQQQTGVRLAAAAAASGVGRVVEVDDARAIAFTHGLLRPRVIVSTGLLDALDDGALAAVIAHEACHVRRRDPLRVLIARTVSRVAFPFPVLARLAEHSILQAELTADGYATHTTSRGALARGMLQVLSCSRMTFGTEAVAGIDTGMARVAHLRDGSTPRLALGRTAVVASTVAAIGLIAIAAPSYTAQQRASIIVPAAEVVHVPLGD